MDEPALRVLLASALNRVAAPIIEREIPGILVTTAACGSEVRRAIAHRAKYDAVVTDLAWNDYRIEHDFDGLDVLGLLREYDRIAPVIYAIQGHGIEREHIQEAILQPEVKFLIRKADGIDPLIRTILAAAYGDSPPPGTSVAKVHRDCWSIHRIFSHPRSGSTLARMAGAIAAGRASDAESLAAATGLGLNTVNKLVQYFGPLIIARGEHDPQLRMTAQVVYRWCGEHSHYIRSWCRRHGCQDLIVKTISTSR